MVPKILGAILGAVISPLLMVALVAAVYPKVGGTNYDSATGALVLAFGTLALIGGAVGGALVANALQAGNTRAAMVIAGIMFALIAAFPVWLASVYYLPTVPRGRTSASDRTKWTARMDDFYDRHAPAAAGFSFAWSVRAALQDGDFGSHEWRRYSGDESAFAASELVYRIEDDGWRWDTIAGGSGRATVFLDPRLSHQSPVFEVDADDIYRRETRGAQSFMADSSIPVMLAIPDCIESFARRLRAESAWDGNADTLPRLIAERWSTPDGCPALRWSNIRRKPTDAWVFGAKGAALSLVEFTLRPDSTGSKPFQFSFQRDRRTFLRDANGAWHMASRRPAGHSDPPPPRCFFDQGTPCG